jgi:hypothetical protein
MIQHAGGSEREALLADLLARTRWRSPLRAWRIRAAIRASLKAVRRSGRPPFSDGAPPDSDRSGAAGRPTEAGR